MHLSTPPTTKSPVTSSSAAALIDHQLEVDSSVSIEAVYVDGNNEQSLSGGLVRSASNDDNGASTQKNLKKHLKTLINTKQQLLQEQQQSNTHEIVRKLNLISNFIDHMLNKKTKPTNNFTIEMVTEKFVQFEQLILQLPEGSLELEWFDKQCQLWYVLFFISFQLLIYLLMLLFTQEPYSGL